MKTEEEYQEAIELNPEQNKAFKALERAVKKCKESNIYFYMVLDSLGALNGDNVDKVEDHDGIAFSNHSNKGCGAPDCLQYKSFPFINVTDAWADDDHFIILK